MKVTKRLPFTVGICTYNEENNIGKLLDNIVKQDVGLFFLNKIIIVSSGSTDKTVKMISKHYLYKKNKILLVKEKKRYGKASSLNLILTHCKTKLLIIESADTFPSRNAYRFLLTALNKKDIGLAAAQIRPLKINKKTLIGFANWLMWEMHNQINLKNPQRPKVGEIMAFKKIFEKIPKRTATDEAHIELLILGQGYKIIYCPQAIVFNKVPTNIKEFISRRRSNYYGHTKLADKLGYQVITFNNFRLLLIFFTMWQWDINFICKSITVVMLELVARIFATADYYFQLRDHTVWKIAQSTKN